MLSTPLCTLYTSLVYTRCTQYRYHCKLYWYLGVEDARPHQTGKVQAPHLEYQININYTEVNQINNS